jgi:hypothetical protein
MVIYKLNGHGQSSLLKTCVWSGVQEEKEASFVFKNG